jgi:hypothetical protein
MKKLFLFFAALFMVVALSAQTNQIKRNGFAHLEDVAKYATGSYTYKVEQPERYYLHYQFNMDSISGTDAATGGVFTIYGSLDGTDYNSIATTTYAAIAGVSSDTTVFNIGTTAYGYRYLRVTYTLTDTLQVGHFIRVVSDQR